METIELGTVLFIRNVQGYFCLDFDHPIDKERRENERKSTCHLHNVINIKCQ